MQSLAVPVFNGHFAARGHHDETTTTRQVYNSNVPGAVDGWDGIAVSTGVLKESKKVITGDNTRRDDIVQGSHFSKVRVVVVLVVYKEL